MTEIRQQCERHISYEDGHLYDGKCRRCRQPAIRRGNAWFHTTPVWSCEADMDPDSDWFEMSDDPLGNCHCIKCAEFRKNCQLTLEELVQAKNQYKIERRRDA